MAYEKVYRCTGQLPGGKQCASQILEAAAFVPPFSQISLGIPTVAQLEAAVLCDRCGRRYQADMGVRKMYHLGASLAVARKYHGDVHEEITLGSLLAEKRVAEREEAARQQAEAVRHSLHRVRAREQNERLLRALAQCV